jgi:hypothetical protein
MICEFLLLLRNSPSLFSRYARLASPDKQHHPLLFLKDAYLKKGKGCSWFFGRSDECMQTGARRGEAWNLTWIDIDLTRGTINITPEKGSNPRIFAITPKLAKMIGALPQKLEGRIWKYTTIVNLEKTFRRQRKRTAYKLQNPRLLQIHFHMLRHWKATTEYAKTKDSSTCRSFSTTKA